MFLLLMPIFAAPWEALAAFRELPVSSTELTPVFMGVGVPMYYVTAHSRAAKVGSAYVDPGAGPGAGSGFKATARSECTSAFIVDIQLTAAAWATFVEDVSGILPARLHALLRIRPRHQAYEDVQYGMLEDHEMRERDRR